MEKCLKPIQKTEKENANLMKHQYVASMSMTLVHSEVTKHSNYTLYFTCSHVKTNASFGKWNAPYAKSNMLEKLKQL